MFRIAVLSLLALVLAGAPASSGAASSTPLAILGFQSESSAPALIDRNAHSLTMIGVDGLDLIGPGLVSSPDQAAIGQQARASDDHLPAVLLVSNWSAKINDFYEPLAYETLHSPAATSSVAAALAGEVEAGGWNGISVDLESLKARDSVGLALFVADLRQDLPSSDSLTVCVSAFSSFADYQANGYDLAALAASTAQIVLMTYDDHGPWENTPGPIGPLSWQRASVRAAERAIPARQLFLGAANYGYAWQPHSNISLSIAQARSLVRRQRLQPRWIPSVGEWTAHLPDGSTLWWSDQRSVKLRLELARSLGLHGVAIWSLSGDPIPSI